MKNSGYLLTLIAILLVSGILLFTRFNRYGTPSFASDIRGAFASIADYLIDNIHTSVSVEKGRSVKTVQQPPAALQPTQQPRPNRATPKPISTPKPTSHSSQPTTYNSQQKSCYRYTVPHLDGSSSTRCYNRPDYDQLVNLGSQYSSAKANYEFELRVARMYSDPPSDFFQKSADEANRKAQEWKDKMGQIALQMYNIESRGW